MRRHGLETASFVGVLTGTGLLVASLLDPGLRHLALPGLLFLFPGLVYGMR